MHDEEMEKKFKEKEGQLSECRRQPLERCVMTMLYRDFDIKLDTEIDIVTHLQRCGGTAEKAKEIVRDHRECHKDADPGPARMSKSAKEPDSEEKEIRWGGLSEEQEEKIFLLYALCSILCLVIGCVVGIIIGVLVCSLGGWLGLMCGHRV